MQREMSDIHKIPIIRGPLWQRRKTKRSRLITSQTEIRKMDLDKVEQTKVQEIEHAEWNISKPNLLHQSLLGVGVKETEGTKIEQQLNMKIRRFSSKKLKLFIPQRSKQNIRQNSFNNKEINTQNICVRDGRFGLKRGFLSTPNYPDSYTSDQDCHCNMTTAPGKKLKFKFPDSALEWSHSCTKDKVKIMDGGQAITRCGKLPRMYNYTTYSNTVEVHFISDNWKEDKGFWLQYEADSNIEVFCGPTNWVPTTTTTTTEAPTTTPKPGSSSEGTYLGPGDPTHDNTSLVGIIIAAVIGFIVLVVLIVLLIRFRRKRHMEKISKAPVEPARHPKLHKHHGDKPPGSPGAPGGPTTPKANKHNDDDKDDKP